jgi:hypothetical protein
MLLDAIQERYGVDADEARRIAYLLFLRGPGVSGEAPPAPLALDDLSDVEIIDPQNGDELVYDDGVWRNQ